MLDSVWKRWLLAAGAAVLVAAAITTLLSGTSHEAKKKGADAVAMWKARTGIDLAAHSRLHPPQPDTEATRGLDAILWPAGLRLGSRSDSRRPPSGDSGDSEAFDTLREALRAEIRFDAIEVKALPAPVVSLIERHAAMLDAVAGHVRDHGDIRWYEDFGPRRRSSTLYLDDHLTLHRLLIGRAFLALERGDIETVRGMLSTSQHLNGVLAKRRELASQFYCLAVERLQLALLRRAGNTLGVSNEAPRQDLPHRYLAAMSAEAALVVANARQDAFSGEGDPPDRVIRVLAGGKLELAASEAVIAAADGVAEILRAADGCAELKKERRAPAGPFSGAFHTLDATEAWRRFVVLSIDRAITSAALTGRASSPCASVSITVRDDGTTRTVEAKGLPSESPNVIRLPEKVSVSLKR